MAKKRKRIKNKKKVRPVNYLDRLNGLKNGEFVSNDVPLFSGTSKPNEFVTIDGAIIPDGTPYHIDFDGVLKEEYYFTGTRFSSDSQSIYRIKGESAFGQYKRLKGSLNSQQYFTETQFEPSKKDLKRGFAYRFFARKRFGDKKLIEITEVDFQKNSKMYTTVETRWEVGDNKQKIQIKNTANKENLLKKGFVELENLNVMQGYTGPDDDLIVLTSLEKFKTQEKKKKTKKRISKKGKGKKGRGRNRTQSTQTQTTEAPTGGSGGAY